ncbi:ATP-grasp domain-containing protein [Limosilactobacillus reuteri]|nr:ATP-grasp domain-containing protein [Limosilactobacillus reuteri]
MPDYPPVLEPYLGRKIWKDTINHISADRSTWGHFVKPVMGKAFTGKVINSTTDLIGTGSNDENLAVYCSDVINIKREWRGFYYHDQLIDVRPYHGDWHYHYDPAMLDAVVAAFNTWDQRPVACSLDFALVERDDGRLETIFLEVNDAYSLGNYGLFPIRYAKMISARWAQLMGREDEYYFGEIW